ncbi:alkyldihydroxyacetonephosphate synthase [Glaciihabitans tibetensis]|uniref:Alkyldihydroxyacetonephosphate synthase n=1 Tax=Glaciihabitans tibetensis TaxID=1266600 RepID=A0A2T0VAC5_9MICO|nr:FAD-binding oxidoreductase [Glaciihabitans tibetensis]PRY67114.1 alkyldihydroxyacetonephosphate synthase [Glaciihabitans tibetensis]
MTDVKHMKWWGWGLEGIAFHHENKPGFAPFLKSAVGVDLSLPTEPTSMAFEDLDVPASRASDAFLTALTGIVGATYLTTNDMDRVIHTFGKSIRDLLRVRAGDLARVPDVVIYPADEAEVQDIVDAAVEADAVIIPFGGGSNIVGSLEPLATEERTVISLDLGRLNRVLDIDEGSGLARIQAGAQGPDLEAELTKAGWTIGHFPDSFTHSTVGGWVATRSSGMQSDKYGDIADIAKGLRVVRPGGVLVIRAIPSASTGPSVREMILGSEGRLGVITEVTVQVHRIPANREILAYLYPTWRAGLAAMQAISESDASPSVTRVSDGNETVFSFATSKASKGLSSLVTKGLGVFLKAKGWDTTKMCLSFVGYEGGDELVSRNQKLVASIVKKHGGVSVGKGPGVLYDQKKFDTPYIRDFFLDFGGSADVSETAAPWSKLLPLYTDVIASANRAFDEIGVKGWIMAHMSHSYHSGACLYFTFAFVSTGDAIAQYDVVKTAIQQAFITNGGTVSHHHGVGLEHAPWLEEDISSEGIAMMRGLFDAADPKGTFNPGKVVLGSTTKVEQSALG